MRDRTVSAIGGRRRGRPEYWGDEAVADAWTVDVARLERGCVFNRNLTADVVNVRGGPARWARRREPWTPSSNEDPPCTPMQAPLLLEATEYCKHIANRHDWNGSCVRTRNLWILGLPIGSIHTRVIWRQHHEHRQNN